MRALPGLSEHLPADDDPYGRGRARGHAGGNEGPPAAVSAAGIVCRRVEPGVTCAAYPAAVPVTAAFWSLAGMCTNSSAGFGLSTAGLGGLISYFTGRWWSAYCRFSLTTLANFQSILT